MEDLPGDGQLDPGRLGREAGAFSVMIHILLALPRSEGECDDKENSSDQTCFLCWSQPLSAQPAWKAVSLSAMNRQDGNEDNLLTVKLGSKLLPQILGLGVG